MPDFDRSRAWMGRSIAYAVFRTQFTELNSQYWAGVPSELLSRRFVADHHGGDDFKTALQVRSDSWNAVGHSVATYAERFEIHRGWSRRLTLILLTSCFERFLDSISAAAVASDPLRKPGFPKPVDGASFLKHGTDVPSLSDPLTVGDWSRRISVYTKNFGDPPAALRAAEGELERLRVHRNQIAHQFGLDDGIVRPGAQPSARPISHDSLIKLFDTVFRVVDAVEQHLTTDFVGDFETIEIYHLLRTERKALLRRTGVSDVAHGGAHWKLFQNFAGEFFGHSPGTQYCRQMQDFYRTLA
ncbi:MAG: hypothetical protein ACE37B_11255 [Ilumatobacter sp.]|uniref:hypothetical protein n=1 Tax=Ilumatobacter sp. TaxID=1967498 RepID=UPI00391CBE3E